MRTEADIARIVAFGEKKIQSLPDVAVLRRFNTAVSSLLEGKPTPLADPRNMLLMFGLDTDIPDNTKFEARFLIGAPDKVAGILANKSNEAARGLYYAPSLVKLNTIIDNIVEGTASVDQRHFLNGLRVSVYRQLKREGEENFCDMACDLAVAMLKMNPASFDEDIKRTILMLSAPIDRERHFTKVTDDMLVAPAQVAGHLLDPALREDIVF